MNTFRENALRVIAVIGLLAVLLLGAWGIIQIAFALPSFFGNLSGAIGGGFHSNTTKSESLTVSVPATVQAQQPFALNWAHTGKTGEYSYAVSYSCEQGLTIESPVPTGTWTAVACNTPFNYINASTSLPLVALLASGTSAAHPTFTLTATQLSSGKVTATAHASTNVTAPASATKPATTPAKTTTKPKTSGATYYASGRTSNLSGYPDLAVSVTSASSQGGNTTVTFVVQNIGTNVAPGGWTLNALLPINGSYTYPAGPQQTMYPGDKIVYTLRYSESNPSAQTGYNNNYYGSPCSLGTGYPCTAAPYITGGPGTCNAYGPCNVPGYSQNLLPYPYNPSYNYSNTGNYGYTGVYAYTGQYGQGYGAYGAAETVSVQIDPLNYVIESTKSNNYASATYIAY